MNMKQRIFSLLLAICLVTGLFPTVAMAEGQAFQIWIGGVQVTEANCSDVLAGTENAGKVSFDSEHKILTLNGVQLAKESDMNGILCIEEDGVTVRLAGENSFEEQGLLKYYQLNTVKSSGDLTFDGTGSLSIKNESSKKNVYGIYCMGDLTINGGNISIHNGECTAASGSYNNQAVYVSGKIDILGGRLETVSGTAPELSSGMITTRDITIRNAEVFAQAGKGKNSYGVYTNQPIVCEQAKVTGIGGEAKNWSEGIHCEGSNMQIAGSVVTAKGGTAGSGSYGIEAIQKLTLQSGQIIAGAGEAPFSVPVWCPAMEVMDGKVDVKGGTATEESYGISAAEFTMKGGEVRVEAGNAANWSIGLWSNDVTISGGLLTAVAGQANGTNAITVSPVFSDYEAVVKAGASEADAVKVATPTDETYWASRYVRIEKFVHEHAWLESFESDTQHHWHECTAEDCPITDNSGKDGYAEHSYNQEIASDDYLKTAATCLSPAVYYKSCICGAKGTQTFTAADVGSALGHDLGEWQTINSPTCTEKGLRKRSCSRCDYFETEGLNPNGHDWETEFTIDKKPTCVTDGSKSLHCKNCAETKDNTVIPATGHSFENGVCSICGKADPDYSKPATPVPPQTGDNRNPWLWFALAFISGGAVLTLNVMGRKKKEGGK